MNNRYFYGIWILIFISLMIPVSFAQEVLTEIQAKQMALGAFQKEVPNEIKGEYRLVFSGRVEYVQGDVSTYKVFWQRYVNNILVPKDGFSVVIDLRNGDIIAKSLSYSVPASQIDTTYSLSQDQAKWILQQKRWHIETEPRLMYKDGKVVWDMNVEGCEMGIDAKNGNITIYGCATGTAPIDTAFTFSTTEYYISAYGIYILFGVALVGGIFYYKKYLLASKRK